MAGQRGRGRQGAGCARRQPAPQARGGWRATHRADDAGCRLHAAMTPQRLATRLGIAFSTLFLLTFAVILAIDLYLAARWAETALDDHVTSVAAAAVEQLDAGGRPGAVADLVASAAQFVEIRDADW